MPNEVSFAVAHEVTSFNVCLFACQDEWLQPQQKVPAGTDDSVFARSQSQSHPLLQWPMNA